MGTNLITQNALCNENMFFATLTLPVPTNPKRLLQE